MQISLSYVTRHEFAGFLGVSMLNYRVQVKPLSKVQHYLFYALTSKDQSFMCFLKKKAQIWYLINIFKMQSNILCLLTGRFCTFIFTVINDVLGHTYQFMDSLSFLSSQTFLLGLFSFSWKDVP